MTFSISAIYSWTENIKYPSGGIDISNEKSKKCWEIFEAPGMKMARIQAIKILKTFEEKQLPAEQKGPHIWSSKPRQWSVIFSQIFEL
jgi:hypothetical protein